MPANTINMPLSRLTKDMTVNIILTGTMRFRLGLWLLTHAVKVAAWVGRFNVNVESSVEQK